MGYVPDIQIYLSPLLILHLALIKESCPWFFEMRELIGERPNVVPSGLGNGTSEMNMGSFFDGPDQLDDDGIGSPTRWGIVDDDSVDSDENMGGDGSDDGRQTQGKDKAGTSSKEAAKLGRTGARPGSSRPATRPTKENKKKRKVEFADVVEAEEVTRQKGLDLAKAKVEAQQARMATKQAEIAYKTLKMTDRTERWREKNRERTMKLHLLQLREQRGMGSTDHPTHFGGMHAAASGSGSLLGMNSLTPNPSVHSSTSNQAYQSTSSSGSYYRSSGRSDTTPNDNEQPSEPNEFAFAHAPELVHSSHSGDTLSSQSSENGREHSSSPMSSSFHNPFQ